METFLYALLDIFNWTALTSQEKTVTIVAWLVVLALAAAVALAVMLA